MSKAIKCRFCNVVAMLPSLVCVSCRENNILFVGRPELQTKTNPPNKKIREIIKRVRKGETVVIE